MVDADPVPYTTPTSLTLSRKQDHHLVFSKDGYENYNVDLTRSTSGAVYGNILAGGLIGTAADYSNGAAYTLNNANLVDDLLTIHLISRQQTEVKPVAQAPAANGTPADSPAGRAPGESTDGSNDLAHDGSIDGTPQK
jgi:hypothetical protein